MKTRRIRLAGLAVIALLTLLTALLLWERPVTLVLDGQAQTLHTRAWTVAGALDDAGLALTPEDRLEPAAGSLLLGQPTIHLDHAHTVQIVVGNDPQQITLRTPERRPSDWLAQAQLSPGPDDRLFWNGQPIQAAEELPLRDAYLLQIYPAVTLTLHDGAETRTLRSAAGTVGEALADAGVTWAVSDRLSLSPSAPLNDGLEMTLVRAQPVSIQANGKTISAATSAQTVGEALAEAGIALQGLDYSQPGESDPLPASGAIRVVRVREEIDLEQQPIPYTKEFKPDKNVELDQRAVTQPGEFGLQVSRVRVRYEDGQEVDRQEEAQWEAKQPKNEVVGYGTKVVVKTLDTPDGPVEYWRAVTVYATSYSPCRSAADRCYPGTSSGLPVTRGVVGVTRSWYNWFVGQKLYVPGYGNGVVADVGGGVPGKYWIDLGFSDADFQPWHQDVTIYFLTPVPANIPWILP